MRRLFRYPLGDILLLIGFSVCFFAAFLTTGLLNKIEYAGMRQEKNQYPYSLTFSMLNSTIPIEYEDGVRIAHYSEGEIIRLTDEVFPYFSALQGRLYAKLWMNIGSSGTRYPVKLLFSGQAWLGELKSGCYPDEKELSGEVPVAIVGETVMEYAREKEDGYYLTVSDIECRVAGVLENGNVADYDMTVWLYCQGGEKLEEMINDTFAAGFNQGDETVVYWDSKEDCTEEFVSVQEYLLSHCKVSVQPAFVYDSPQEKELLYTAFNTVFLIILYIFSFFNVMIISGFWILIRRREFLIRKLHGTGGLEIWFHAMKEAGRLSGMAFAAGFLGYLLYLLMTGGKLLFGGYLLLDLGLFALMELICALMVSIGVCSAYFKLPLTDAV